jgi:hypothetical protein
MTVKALREETSAIVQVELRNPSINEFSGEDGGFCYKFI